MHSLMHSKWPPVPFFGPFLSHLCNTFYLMLINPTRAQSLKHVVPLLVEGEEDGRAEIGRDGAGHGEVGARGELLQKGGHGEAGR